MLSEILVLTQVSVYVLVVLQRGSTKRFCRVDLHFYSAWTGVSSREGLLI